ncbi:predicted divalent heavy-metal cations transporter [Pelotomaculum thermopropionicum SI]|uniref:Predicted divalent heavy-metal cations transporter n=1 Tax=Pelotomaculum thermopropionicum (strain DSM 13744 / JCM 10971 / SI) TaxID=370438 RepID=A5D652_PELTS|nr:predicted divalent heavy-metal cations transporter [Pelotomaculum thermopropionicum SI]
MAAIVLMGLIAGLGTCLGALLVALPGRPRPGVFSFLLGLAAGIMAAVIVIDLVPSSLRYGSLPAALAGFLSGAGLMAILDLAFIFFSPSSARPGSFLKMGFLIAAGIALHDFPEGLAIAAGYAAAKDLGPLLAFAIGLHNIPEGMACAAPLKYGGLSTGLILAINAAISLVTPLGVLLGLAAVKVSGGLIGLLLAFAAGAMTYIILRELAPQSRRNSKFMACLGMAAGAAAIMALGLIF